MPVSGSLVIQWQAVKYGPLSNPGVEMGTGNSSRPPCSRSPSPTWISSLTGPVSTISGASGAATAADHFSKLLPGSQPMPKA